MARATIIHHLKVYLNHEVLDEEAVLEIKIWKVPDDQRFPQGIKYSLYCVRDNHVLVGFDNHHPKGHHMHIENEEFQYEFVSYEKLLKDFFIEIARHGYKL